MVEEVSVLTQDDAREITRAFMSQDETMLEEYCLSTDVNELRLRLEHISHQPVFQAKITGEKIEFDARIRLFDVLEDNYVDETLQIEEIIREVCSSLPGVEDDEYKENLGSRLEGDDFIIYEGTYDCAAESLTWNVDITPKRSRSSLGLCELRHG